jgi:uncharacterized protein (TIGR00251 family)
MSRDQGKFIKDGDFFGWDGAVLVVNILGKPSASKDAIGKPFGKQLKVSVTAAPVAGRATDHMLRFLAPHFGVTPADIEVVFGRMNINKQLRIKAPTKLPSVFTQGAEQASLFDSAAPPGPAQRSADWRQR